jgi:hypothetical protein
MKKEDEKKPKAPTPVRFPLEIEVQLREEAKKQNRSLSNLIITIVKDYFNNKK